MGVSENLTPNRGYFFRRRGYFFRINCACFGEIYVIYKHPIHLDALTAGWLCVVMLFVVVCLWVCVPCCACVVVCFGLGWAYIPRTCVVCDLVLNGIPSS